MKADNCGSALKTLVFRVAVGFFMLTSTHGLVSAQNAAAPDTARVSSKATLDSLFRRLKSDDAAIRESARTTTYRVWLLATGN